MISYTIFYCLISLVFFVQSCFADEGAGVVKTEHSPTYVIALRWGAIVILVALAALFSGLTLGLMGLDKIGLQIVIGAGEAENATERERDLGMKAKRIFAIRENGNLLLTTLLLGNASVNALLPILMAELTNGLIGFFVSTGLILLLGEIIPQAVCSRYAIQIGSAVVPLVKVMMFLAYIIAKPISLFLDWALGEEIGTIHSRQELAKMLDIHVSRQALDTEEGHIMHGAMNYKNMPVSKIMTPVEDIFMLPVTSKLNFQTIRKIFQSGFSRIPVCGRDVNDIVGLLFVKDLIFVDPEDETPVLNFIHIFGRGVHKVWPDSKLGDCLKLFKMGRGHMALVYDVNSEGPTDPFYELKGVVTLEDIIEEIIQDEIEDETDASVDFHYGRLRMLDSRIVDDSLNLEESKAITAHLMANYPQFKTPGADGKPMDEATLRNVICKSSIMDYDKESGQDVKIYQRNRPQNYCTVILQGKVKIIAGREGFVSEAAQWSVIGADSLLLPDGTYIPDFDAVLCEKTRILRISRVDFQCALFPLGKLETDISKSDMKFSPRISSSNVINFDLPRSEPSSGISTLRSQHMDQYTAL